MSITSIANSNYEASSAQRTTELFSKIDSDQDGKISKTEFSAFDEAMKQQGVQGAGGPPPPPPPSDSSGAGGSSMQAPPSADIMFSTADTNGDDSLSVDELSSMLAEHETRSATGSTSSTSSTSSDSIFTTADTDGDGSLSLDELTALLNNSLSSTSGTGTSSSLTVEQLEALFTQQKTSATTASV
jgi:Ca2+-binding EF-hand superfamily protein